MEKLSKVNDLQKFRELFGYGVFREYKDGYEVRIKDLDKGYSRAKKIIAANSLKLELTELNVLLRSFVVRPY